MIEITQEDKIKEIKALRDYALTQYGFTGGLREAKDFIDSVQESQQADLQKKVSALNDALSSADRSLAIKVASDFLSRNGYQVREDDIPF